MVALIDALDRGRQRRRRAGLAVLGIGVLAGAVAVARGRPTPCEGLRDATMPGWTQTERTTVRDAIEAAAGEHATVIWPATERGLDEYAAAWSAARARACEATHVERVAGTELLESRTVCLEGRLLRAQATIELLSDADARVAARAPYAVRSLPPVEPCLDAARARGLPPLPSELSDAAAQVQRSIARSWAFDATGRADQGLLAAEDAVARAEGLGEPGALLLAQTRFNRGRLLRAVGRLADARRDLEAVVEQAERAEDEALAIDALRSLVGVALDEADRSASSAWMTLVRGKLGRGDHQDPRRHAELRALEGLVALGDEDHEGAVRALEAAATGYAELGADATIERGQVLLHLAQAHARLGHDAAARRAFDEALALAERDGLLPLQAQIHHELGNFHDERGHVEQAEVSLRRALRLRITFDGPHAPVTIPTRTLLAHLLGQQGDLDAAYAMADAARESLGPSVSANRRAQVMTLLASFERMRGDWEAALEHYRQGHEAWSSMPTPDEVELAMLEVSMADCSMMMGRLDAARARYEAALQILEVRVPKDDPRRVYPLLGLAHILYERGETPGAEGLYRRALAIQERVAESPELTALLRWELGRAVLDQATSSAAARAEALTMLAGAREYYGGVGDTVGAADVDAYLDACGSRCADPAIADSANDDAPR